MDIDVTSLHHRRAVHRWERTSVGDLLERLTWSYPDKEAVIGVPGAFAGAEHSRLTYRQADKIANQMANGLLARGLRRSDVVLMCCENSVEAFLAKIGIAKAGLVCAPVNPMMAPDVIGAMITLAGPAAAIVDAEFWPRVEAAFEARSLPVAVTIPIGGGPVPGSTAFADFVAGQPAAEPDVQIHGDDIWEILFTSGTTALPKGVMVSHSATYLGAYGFALSLTRGLRIEADLRMASFLPVIYHISGQVFTFPAFLSGGTLVLGRRLSAAQVAEAVARERITALWAGSPAMVTELDAELRDRLSLDVTGLRVIVYGWGALPPSVLDSLKTRCGQDLVALGTFGQTEAMACHRFWPDTWPELYRRTAPRQNYVGVPGPILASAVLDESAADLAGTPHVAGEAVYRSPSLSAGYYRDEVATAEAYRGGWFHSADSCCYDDNGLRIMVDRYKDIVKVGADVVSSQRVEAVLTQHPRVARAAVIGLPHPRLDEAVTAIVVRAPGRQVTSAELIAHCGKHLAGYEMPKKVLFADGLPETVGGKVLKYKLRVSYADTYFGDNLG